MLFADSQSRMKTCTDGGIELRCMVHCSNRALVPCCSFVVCGQIGLPRRWSNGTCGALVWDAQDRLGAAVAAAVHLKRCPAAVKRREALAELGQHGISL